MYQNKLTRILATFDKWEWSSLHRFIQSPFFNTKEELYQLFVLVEEAMEQQQQATVRSIWDQWFPGKPFNNTQYRRGISDLVKLTEAFLAQREFSRQPSLQQHLLLKTINDRSLDFLFPVQYKQAQKLQAQFPYRNAHYYYQQYLLETEQNRYTEQHFKRSKESNIDKTLVRLDVFYLINKLRYYCIILNMKNVVSMEHEIFLMEEIISHLQSRSYDAVPAINMYYYILLTLTESDNKAHFFQLKDYMQEHIALFQTEEAREIYLFAINYCLKKINSGYVNFLNELFLLYKTALSKELLLEQGKLSPWSYKNIVTTGLRLNEFDWVEEFIFKNQKLIDSRFRENALNYNLARLYYSKGDFNGVLEQLQKVAFNDIFYSLDSRSLLLKTYYELNEFESLYSLIDSFRVFLARNKLISSQHRSNYLNLIRFVKKLTKLQLSPKGKIKKFEAEIDRTKNIADLSWLKEKVGELSAN